MIRGDAAYDALEQMGPQLYYDQLVLDHEEHMATGIADEIDVATARDYIKVCALTCGLALVSILLSCLSAACFWAHIHPFLPLVTRSSR